jgi:hypothetical protein
MTCSDTRAKLTAYLDGDLDADRGTVVRGHLRTCAACRDIAEREAVLRDGLRALPPVDPPASLWANVQAKLAAAEVVESQRPAWRRALARWTRSAWMPRLALAATAAGAAVVLLWWRHQPQPDVVVQTPPPSPAIQVVIKSDSVAPLCKPTTQAEAQDVTADLDAEADRVTASYCSEAESQLAEAAKADWPAAERKAFDARVAELRQRLAQASEPRLRHKVLRELIRYAQTARARDAVALAEVTP